MLPTTLRTLPARLAALALSHPIRTLLIVWLALCLPWLIGQKALPYDAEQEFYPAVAFTVQQLRELEGPWWNPYLFGGYPHFADPQGMTFQPTVILPMLLSPLPSLTWFSAVIVMHVALAGVGAVLLARRYGLQAPAQLLFALTLMFGGVAASRMQHVPMIVSYAFIPWLWWALHRLAERPAVGRSALAGLIGGLCALQMTQVTFLIGLAAIAYGMGLFAMQPRARRWTFLAHLAVAGMVAMLISLPQWLATFAWLPFTNRQQITLEQVAAGPLPWDAFGTLLGVDYFGDRYLGSGDLTQDYMYLGAVPLAVWTMWGGNLSPGHRRLARGLFAGIVVAIVYALGTRTPIYAWLYHHLPGVDLFKRPADSLFLFVPASALLAGLALEARSRSMPYRANWLGWLIVAALCVYAVWYAFVVLQWPAALRGVAATVLIGGLAVWLLRGRTDLKPQVVLAMLALFVVDMAAHNVRGRYYGSRNETRKLYRNADWPDAGKSPMAPVLLRLRDQLQDGPVPQRFEPIGLDDLVNGAAVRQLAMTSGYNPMLYLPYLRMAGASPGVIRTPAERPFTQWAPGFDARMFDLLGLRAIVSREPMQGAVHMDGHYWIRRDSVLPRVLTPTLAVLHGGSEPPADAFVVTDFRSHVWLPAVAARASECVGTTQSARVHAVSYKAGAVTIEYSAETSSWLVLNEIDAPGWWAEVDGRELPLMRANGLFRAVCAPGGSHRLSFRFSPLRMIEAGWRSRWRRHP